MVPLPIRMLFVACCHTRTPGCMDHVVALVEDVLMCTAIPKAQDQVNRILLSERLQLVEGLVTQVNTSLSRSRHAKLVMCIERGRIHNTFLDVLVVALGPTVAITSAIVPAAIRIGLAFAGTLHCLLPS